MTTDKKRVVVNMPTDLFDGLEDLAEFKTLSVSGIVRMACLDYLSRQEFPRRDDMPVDEQERVAA